MRAVVTWRTFVVKPIYKKKENLPLTQTIDSRKINVIYTIREGCTIRDHLRCLISLIREKCVKKAN